MRPRYPVMASGMLVGRAGRGWARPAGSARGPAPSRPAAALCSTSSCGPSGSGGRSPSGTGTSTSRLARRNGLRARSCWLGSTYWPKVSCQPSQPRSRHQARERVSSAGSGEASRIARVERAVPGVADAGRLQDPPVPAHVAGDSDGGVASRQAAQANLTGAMSPHSNSSRFLRTCTASARHGPCRTPGRSRTPCPCPYGTRPGRRSGEWRCDHRGRCVAFSLQGATRERDMTSGRLGSAMERWEAGDLEGAAALFRESAAAGDARGATPAGQPAGGAGRPGRGRGRAPVGDPVGRPGVRAALGHGHGHDAGRAREWPAAHRVLMIAADGADFEVAALAEPRWCSS